MSCDLPNPHRVIACVDACTGMLDGELAGANFRSFIDKYFEIESQRDKLAKALREIAELTARQQIPLTYQIHGIANSVLAQLSQS